MNGQTRTSTDICPYMYCPMDRRTDTDKHGHLSVQVTDRHGHTSKRSVRVRPLYVRVHLVENKGKDKSDEKHPTNG